MDPASDIEQLKRHVRHLRVGMMTMAALLIVGAVARPEALRIHRLVVVDDAGHDRIVLDASGHDARPTINFHAADGAKRLSLGEAPDPVINGEARARIAPAWGLLIHDPHGQERGGFSYLDNGRSVISLDRAQGEGVYLTVNEKSGFAGMVANYDTGRAGKYAEALRIGTLGDKAFAQAANRDGSPAGAVLAAGSGRARLADAVQR